MEPLRVGDHKIVNLQAFRETKGGAYAYGCDDFIDASGILSVEVASERAWLAGREQLGREQDSEKEAERCESLSLLELALAVLEHNQAVGIALGALDGLDEQDRLVLALFQDLGSLGKCLRLEVRLDLENRLSLGDQDTPDFDNTLGIAGHQLGAMGEVDGLFDLDQGFRSRPFDDRFEVGFDREAVVGEELTQKVFTELADLDGSALLAGGINNAEIHRQGITRGLIDDNRHARARCGPRQS